MNVEISLSKEVKLDLEAIVNHLYSMNVNLNRIASELEKQNNKGGKNVQPVFNANTDTDSVGGGSGT